MWQRFVVWFHQWGSPRYFYRKTSKIIPWTTAGCALLMTYGLVGGLLFSPPDYQQGESMRIIYIHVPSAFLSLSIYTTMAIAAAVGLIWHMKLADMVAYNCAPIGASYTFIALVTGSLWGKPMWGTYWIWDARLTSELVLLFLYIGYIALYSAIDDKRQAARASGVLAIVGVVNVPIIHYSVYWWNTLHQGATIAKFDKPSIHIDMLLPLLAMIAAFLLFFVTILLMRVRNQILEREQQSQWVQEEVL